MSIPTEDPRNEQIEVAGEEKILAFCLGSEDYGLEILTVREIIGLIDITPLPRTPDYVKGVMNLRGRIIPVIDLRLKFGLPGADATKETCVIVVESQAEDGERTTMGVVVDSVREVQDIPRSAIEEAPSFGCEIPLDYIKGMPHKLLAFELFLARNPSWVGKVTLIQVGVPTRPWPVRKLMDTSRVDGVKAP